MKSRRTYGRYIAIGLVIVIALICVWALVFTREVSFADAANVDTVDFASMELVSEDSGETIELDAAQRGEVSEALSSLRLVRRPGGTILLGCYARLYVETGSAGRFELLLAPDEMMVAHLSGRESRVYGLDSGCGLEDCVRGLLSLN